jgi:HD-like signal output (HDOD) protein
MTRTRILFVDDEVALLNGLRNVLRRERKRWDMSFAVGADEALAALRSAPFDVVVTDMRMPGMDGAELLARIREDYPRTSRLVLSGHAAREAAVRALAVAHQFLSKPCDAASLRSVVERTHLVHSLIQSDRIKTVIGGIERLPVVPDVYLALQRAAADPNAGLSVIAGIVEQDPALSAQVLQLANSALFGLAQPVTTIAHAVTCVGLTTVKALALTAQLFLLAQKHESEAMDLGRLQQAAVATARVARRFLGNHPKAEEAFTAGLLHDTGKLVLAIGLRDDFLRATRLASEQSRPLPLIEKELLGTTHAEVGAYLLGLWGLPFSIVEAVLLHHEPGRVTDGPCDVLAAVHAADALADLGSRDGKNLADPAELDIAFFERTGFAQAMESWRAIAEEERIRHERAA